MTVAELIKELQKFPPDTLVLKYRPNGTCPRWETMDGHWFQMVEVVRIDSPLNAGQYAEPRGRHDDTIDALEI